MFVEVPITVRFSDLQGSLDQAIDQLDGIKGEIGLACELESLSFSRLFDSFSYQLASGPQTF